MTKTGSTGAAPTGRDTAIDVLRALALLTIFVNHVPGNPFEFLTHKNFGFSDSAEAFVLISGIAAGLAYGSKFVPGMRRMMTLKAWRRAGVLYIAQIATTVATLGIFAFVAVNFDAPEILAKINIGPVLERTPESLIGLATLGHQLGYNNILSMYAVVLLIVPVMLFLGRYSLLLMVSVSGAIWFAAGLFEIAPAAYPNDGVWFLNPLSWQFLFVIGMAATMHVKRGGEIRPAPVLVGLCCIYVVGALVWVKLPLWGLENAIDLPKVLAGFDKTYLSLPRLAHVLAIAYLIVVMPRLLPALRLERSNPLTVVGVHALPVFIAGTVLAMAAQAWREANGTTIPGDIAIVVAGLALQFALALYLDWYARLKKSAAPRPLESVRRITPPRPAVPAKLSAAEIAVPVPATPRRRDRV